MSIRFSGDKYHARVSYKGIERYAEVIYDGKGTEYGRTSDSEVWYPLSVGADHALPFPYSADSLCPDLADTTFEGDVTLEGVPARRYSVNTPDGDWIAWIDEDGWLIQAEQIEGWATGSSGEPHTNRATFSGIGEPNDIIIPNVGE